MAKKHATEDEPHPYKTLCGERVGLVIDNGTRVLPRTSIDNAAPDCKRCLRVIDARYRSTPG